MIFDVSPRLPYDFGGKRLFFYFFEKQTNRVVPKARSRTEVKSPGRIRGSARFRVPTDHRYRFFVPWCFEHREKDVGVGKPGPGKCPRKTVSVKEFNNKLPPAPSGARTTISTQVQR